MLRCAKCQWYSGKLLRFFFGPLDLLNQPFNLRLVLTHLFFWSTTFLEPDLLNQISQTRFLKPIFYTFLEKWLQNKWSNATHWLKLQHSDWKENLVKDLFWQIKFLTGHVIFNGAYNEIFQLKTYGLDNWCFWESMKCYINPDSFVWRPK